MRSAVADIANDSAIRVLIITGAKDQPVEGKRPKPAAFVAGADIVLMSKMPVQGGDEAKGFVETGQELMNDLGKLSIPVIAAVDGFALGGGTELAISCDIIYASDRSQFGQPEVKLGLIPGFGGTQRLARLIGKNMAKELIYTGDIIDAARAKEIGLVNKVTTPETLMDEVMGLAKRIIACAPLAVGASKKAIDDGFNKELDAGNRIELENFYASFNTHDRVEGTNAFVEKRKPEFKGN